MTQGQGLEEGYFCSNNGVRLLPAPPARRTAGPPVPLQAAAPDRSRGRQGNGGGGAEAGVLDTQRSSRGEAVFLQATAPPGWRGPRPSTSSRPGPAGALCGGSPCARSSRGQPVALARPEPFPRFFFVSFLGAKRRILRFSGHGGRVGSVTRGSSNSKQG